MSVREASHAGSWYTSSKSQLASQLDGWLEAVKPPVKCIGQSSATGAAIEALPVPGARIIIAPHAGYSYSGPAAAWAYKSWDVSKAKRVFLLGPSHHVHLTNAALTRHTSYATPLGSLPIDTATTSALHSTGAFSYMSTSTDSDEHSLEMHLPYIHRILSTSQHASGSALPPLVPILIGNTSASTERNVGKILAPYLADESNAFVISSDFAHWGLRFRYTHYQPSASLSASLSTSASASTPEPINLRERDKTPTNPPIHESIKAVDFECIAACETGVHEEWLAVLARTENTVCGRHPIGVVLAGIEEVERKRGTGRGEEGRFRFVRYERSSEVARVSESSVSYASAFAVL